MLSYAVTYSDGTSQPLRSVLRAKVTLDTEVPAHSMELVCAYHSRLRTDARYLTARQGEETVFYGRVDECVSVHADTAFVCLSARSLAAELLDSEAEPLVYNDPSASVMFRRHLLPCGIREYSDGGSNTPLFGMFRINKGMTHWQVLEKFCKSRYNSTPFISGSGKAYLGGYYPEGTARFGKNGIACLAVRETRAPHKLISRILLRTALDKGYEMWIDNDHPECGAMQRLRYVDVTADKGSIDIPEKMLRRCNRDSYALRLECPGCRLELLGRQAVLRDALLGELTGLRVSTASYRMDAEEKTILILRKEPG